MTRSLAASAAILVAAIVASVANAGDFKPPVEVWTGGDPAKLAVDKASCQKEAADLDVNQASNYSDPRYGVTAAMAAAVGRDNPLSDQGPAIRRAAFEICMNDKGWKSQ